MFDTLQEAAKLNFSAVVMVVIPISISYIFYCIIVYLGLGW